MEKILKLNDKLGLKIYTEQLFQAHPELNKKYPTPRHKDKTYIVDFKDIEDRGGASLQDCLCLNRFERKIYQAICVVPIIEDLLFNYDFEVVTKQFTLKQKFVFEKRMEGLTQQEIAKMLNISRKNVIKHLDLIKNKIKKHWEFK